MSDTSGIYPTVLYTHKTILWNITRSIYPWKNRVSKDIALLGDNMIFIASHKDFAMEDFIGVLCVAGVKSL